MVSKIDICNSALARCGAEQIKSLTEENKRAMTLLGILQSQELN
jgi:hypothetical protein